MNKWDDLGVKTPIFLVQHPMIRFPTGGLDKLLAMFMDQMRHPLPATGAVGVFSVTARVAAS